MKILGFNYRLTDIQCALGISQIKKLEKFVKKRTKIASIYNKSFKNFKNVELFLPKKYVSSSYHLYPIKVKFNKLKISKNQFFNILFKNKIKLQVHYIPIYHHSFYKKKLNLKRNQFPSTEKFYKEIISLPIFYTLKKSVQLKVIQKIKKIIQHYSI